MKKVFIIHGFGGIPNGGWFPWLMSELEQKNTFACSIPMPNPKTPVVSEWVNALQTFIGTSSDETILVGHSLGVPGILHYLESLPEGQSFGGIVLVSGFTEPLDMDNSQSDFRRIDSFVSQPFNFRQIKNTAKSFSVIHGSVDPVVPFLQAEKLSFDLGCTLVRVEGGDHFSQKMDPICYKLPQALEEILRMIK